MYLDRVQGYESFEKSFMVTLVGAFYVRRTSSVASESLFSLAGYIQRKEKSSLVSDTLFYSMVFRDGNILATLV